MFEIGCSNVMAIQTHCCHAMDVYVDDVSQHTVVCFKQSVPDVSVVWLAVVVCCVVAVVTHPCDGSVGLMLPRSGCASVLLLIVMGYPSLLLLTVVANRVTKL